MSDLDRQYMGDQKKEVEDAHMERIEEALEEFIDERCKEFWEENHCPFNRETIIDMIRKVTGRMS